MKLLNLALILLCLILQGKLWLGEGGVRLLTSHQQQVDAIQSEIAQLKQRNNQLMAEVQDLDQGKEAVEERAREEFGYVRQNERFIRIIDASISIH